MDKDPPRAVSVPNSSRAPRLTPCLDPETPARSLQPCQTGTRGQGMAPAPRTPSICVAAAAGPSSAPKGSPFPRCSPSPGPIKTCPVRRSSSEALLASEDEATAPPHRTPPPHTVLQSTDPAVLRPPRDAGCKMRVRATLQAELPVHKYQRGQSRPPRRAFDCSCLPRAHP